MVVACWAVTPFKLCEGAPTDLKVTGAVVPNCDAAPCEIKKGTNVSISITFTASKAFSTIQNKVYGEIAGVDVPFPGWPADQTDVCKLGVKCPTKAGQSYTEKVLLPVATSDPPITLVAKWKLTDGSNTLGCLEVPLKIVS